MPQPQPNDDGHVHTCTCGHHWSCRTAPVRDYDGGTSAGWSWHWPCGDDTACPTCAWLDARRGHIDAPACAARYPRLIRVMSWVAILSTNEAACAVRDYRDGWRGPGSGGEAVAHFGGTAATIRAALRARHVFARFETLIDLPGRSPR